MSEPEPVPGEQFHSQALPYYSRRLGWAVTKRAEHMARVVYAPNHPNSAETGARAGRGRTVARWVLCGRPHDGEGIVAAPLDLVIDAWLEPDAAIGLHRHLDTEEIYYLLEGGLTVTTRAPDGREHTTDLRPGDAHVLVLGQAHSCLAGSAGARLLTIAVRAPSGHPSAAGTP